MFNSARFQTQAPPMKLFKSSLSATFSREAANVMANSSKVTELLSFLKNTYCPDESIWATIAGNPDILPMPGGFNATDLLKAKKQNTKAVKKAKNLPFEPYKPGPGETFYPTQYYISRFQLWNNKAKCKGQLISGSCVFGVGDLPTLVKRPELVAHKLYLNYQPGAYFCLLRNHWKRSLNFKEQAKFNAKGYSTIAQVEYLHGKPASDLWFYRPEHFHYV